LQPRAALRNDASDLLAILGPLAALRFRAAEITDALALRLAR
jgi:hypothetical protein